MPEWADYTQAQRLKILRGKEFTQEALAARAGLSPKTIQKAEQGGTVSLATLLALAAALGTDVSVIVGQRSPEQGVSRSQRAMLQGIAAAVHDTAAGYIPEHAPTSTRRELQAVVDSAWQMYWAADYSEAGALLPPLLYAAHRAAHEAADGESGPALSALSDGYQVAAYVANQLGRRDLAYTAATEASAAARRAGDPIRTARVEGCRSWIYRKDGRVKDSLAIAERAAASIEPSYSAASTAQLTAYGNLVMHCAVASSRLEREQPARDYLSQAHAVGARLGREYHAHGGQFGPANAAAKAVDVLLAVKQVGQALDLISTFHGQADLAPAVRHRYQLDVALAQCEARQWDTCLDTLLAVCTEAPDWARHQTLPAVIVSRLQGGSQSRLRKVSAILGSTPA